MHGRDAGVVHVQRHVRFYDADQFVLAGAVVRGAAAVDLFVAGLCFFFVPAFAQAGAFFDFFAVVSLRYKLAHGAVSPLREERCVFDAGRHAVEQEIFRRNGFDLDRAGALGAA